LVKLREETTDKGVTSAIRVNDFFLRNKSDWVLFDLVFSSGLIPGSHYGWLTTLSNNGNSLSIGVRFLEFGKIQSNVFSICGFQFLNLTPEISFVLVCKNVISIFETGLDLFLVELDQEGGGEVVSQWDIVISGVLTNFLKSLVVAGDEEGSGIDEFGSLQLSHVVLQVLGGVLACGRKIGAEGSLFLVNDDTTGTSLNTTFLVEHTLDLLFREGVFKNLTIVIVRDGAKVGDLFLNTLMVQHVVGGTGRVKG